jgi:DNA-binding MarR family transcriptional regulator
MDSSTLFDALADSTRRQMLERLAVAPASVQGVSVGLGVSLSAVSQHLKVLRDAGLVTYRSDGRRRIYRVAPGAFEVVVENLAGLLHRRDLIDASPRDDPLEALAQRRARTWPQLDPLNVLISFRVEWLVHAMDRGMERIAAHAGLTLGGMLVLGAIKSFGPPYETSPTELKAALWISLPGIGKRLDGLERRGFVERVPNPADRRGRIVRLTGRGSAALEATHLGMEIPSYVALTQIPRELRVELERLLHRWQRQSEQASSRVRTSPYAGGLAPIDTEAPRN